MLYAEDFHPDQEFPFGRWTITEQDVVDYARRWDPLPMHLDPVGAAAGPHGGLIASGLHTLGVYQRLVVAALWARTAVVAGRGFEHLRLLRPVRPGAVLTGRALIAGVTPRPERDDALLVVEGRLTDEDGNGLLDLRSEGVVAGREKWARLWPSPARASDRGGPVTADQSAGREPR